MKAVHYNSYGDAQVLEFTENAPKPQLQKEQVLIQVKAVSINPIDWKVRAGYLQKMVPLHFPVIIGGDFAGVVTEVGESVTEFNIGDEVYGQGGILNGGSGSFAEFVAAQVNKTSSKPSHTNFEQAASLPLVGISALQAVEDEIDIQPDQKILIHGGAGGIGSIAIQIAKAKGAYVATTVGTKDIEFVKQLGADEVIDYKIQQFETMLKDFDAVFDTAGGDTVSKSFAVLKPGGILVSMNGKPDEQLAQQYHVRVIGQASESNPDRFKRLTDLVESGKVKPEIDKVFPLLEAKDAFAYQEKSHPRGKVVLTIS